MSISDRRIRRDSSEGRGVEGRDVHIRPFFESVPAKTVPGTDISAGECSVLFGS